MIAPGNTVANEQHEGYVLVRLSGEVDLSWSQTVRRAVLDAMNQNLPVGVDLSAVSYIDSSGIAALVEGFQRARSHGRRFVLVSISSATRAVLELARLDRVFQLVDSPDDVIEPA